MISIYRESDIFDEDQIQRINYAVKSIANDISKLMILLGVAVLADMVVLFLMILIPFVTVRTFSGGIHMKTYWGCLGLTASFIFGSMLCAFYGKEHVEIILLFTMISFAGYSYIGPKVSSQKKKLTVKRKKCFKGTSILLEVIYCLIVILFIQNPLYQAGICIALLINNLQVLILHGMERRGKMRKLIKISGSLLSVLAGCIASLSSGLLAGEIELPENLK